MRAPEASALSLRLGKPMPSPDFFYRDPDLCTTESAPGFIAPAAILRALSMLELPQAQSSEVGIALGCLATEVKDWLQPERACRETVEQIMNWLQGGGAIDVHGMSQIAYTDRTLFVNGSNTELPADSKPWIASICATRRLSVGASDRFARSDCLLWMLQNGAFEIPEIS